MVLRERRGGVECWGRAPSCGLVGVCHSTVKVFRLFTVFFHSEDRVIEHYKALKGLTRGQAVVQ